MHLHFFNRTDIRSVSVFIMLRVLCDISFEILQLISVQEEDHQVKKHLQVHSFSVCMKRVLRFRRNSIFSTI